MVSGLVSLKDLILGINSFLLSWVDFETSSTTFKLFGKIPVKDLIFVAACFENLAYKLFRWQGY